MSGSASSNGPARTPEGLHALLEHAFNHADLDVYTDAHEDDATFVVPPEGGTVHGRDNIRAAIAPMFTRQPHLRSVVQKKLEGNSLALTHARWTLQALDDDGKPTELTGRGTIVSRRQPDGTWKIALDDPLTPA